MGTHHSRKIEFKRLLKVYQKSVQLDKYGNIVGNLSPPGFQMDYTYRGEGTNSAKSLERVAGSEAARFPGQPFGGPSGTLERIFGAASQGSYSALGEILNLWERVEAIRPLPPEAPQYYLPDLPLRPDAPGVWQLEAPAAHLNESCAVRLSYAISQVDPGFFDGGVRGATWQQPISVWNAKTGRQERVRTPPRLPINARQLAKDLDRIIGERTKFSSRVPGSSGIIFFNRLRHYSGSGHISLWDGSSNAVADLDDGTAGDFFRRAIVVEYWQLWPSKAW